MADETGSAVRDPKHWRRRAAETRALAESIEDPNAREKMLRLAEDYEKLARKTALRVD
jgi:hypothetical protein